MFDVHAYDGAPDGDRAKRVGVVGGISGCDGAAAGGCDESERVQGAAVGDRLAALDARAATGQVELSQTIPAQGVSPITTALSIDTADALTVAAALGSGAHTYELAAKFHFSTGVGQLDVEVKKTGELAM